MEAFALFSTGHIEDSELGKSTNQEETRLEYLVAEDLRSPLKS